MVAKGMCNAHYLRLQAGKDLDAPRKAPWGTGCVDVTGYRYFSLNGRRVAEHRLVMERSIGRKLLREETVHHLNGDRLDNRLENLELWHSGQPPGQRAVDKVAWAEQILRLYGDLREQHEYVW